MTWCINSRPTTLHVFLLPVSRSGPGIFGRQTRLEERKTSDLQRQDELKPSVYHFFRPRDFQNQGPTDTPRLEGKGLGTTGDLKTQLPLIWRFRDSVILRS